MKITASSNPKRRPVFAADEEDFEIQDEEIELEDPDEGKSVADSIDDLSEAVEDVQDTVEEVDEDPVDIEQDSNIANHYIAECDYCHGIFISAVLDSDQEVSSIKGICPVCGKETEQFLKWVVRDIESEDEENV